MALGQLERGTAALIEIARQRLDGELDGPATNAALTAWEHTHGQAISQAVDEAVRALGKPAREALAARWRAASERLERRLETIRHDKATPR